MLTDIFARRYASVMIADAWYTEHRRFLAQAAMMIKDMFGGYDASGKLPDYVEARYKAINNIVGRELGQEFIYPRYWTDPKGQTHKNNYLTICDFYLKMAPAEGSNTDMFVKERLSLVEQAFRFRASEIAQQNAQLAPRIGGAKVQDMLRKSTNTLQSGALGNAMADFDKLFPGRSNQVSLEEQVRNANAALNAGFAEIVHELNERLRIALLPLHFHNGFLQLVSDETTQSQIHEPFWALVKDPMWANVDLQMKEAIDGRDRGDRSAALHAVSALESAIKIISDEKGWSTGKESGASNYIDNLGSSKNGNWLAQWECEILKKMFSGVRNPFAHGPGKAPMPTMSAAQTNWAIDTAMSWTRSLVSRI